MITAVLSIVLSETKKEYAVLLRISAVVLICTFAVKIAFDKIQSFLLQLGMAADADELIQLLVKAAAICIITKLVHEICKESGNTAVAEAVDFSGRVMIVILSLPLMESVIKTAIAFIE